MNYRESKNTEKIIEAHLVRETDAVNVAAVQKSCCFTGHREIAEEDRGTLTARLLDEIRRLADAGVVNFIAGGARGFDTLAAEAVLKLRGEEIPSLRLLLALPCPDQTRGWNVDDRLRYENAFYRADRYVYLRPQYTRGCMHERNRFMVDRSAYCIAYLNDATKGGTAYTVAYARRKGSTVINLGRA